MSDDEVAEGSRKGRHAKTRREPVTIDLAAERLSSEPAADAAAAGVDPDTEAPVLPEDGVVGDGTEAGAADGAVAPGETDADQALGMVAETPPSETEAEADAEAARAEAERAEATRADDERRADVRAAAGMAAAAASPRARGLVAGMAGGAIALVAAGLLQWSGVLPAVTPAPRDADLAEQVAALGARIEALGAPADSGPQEEAVAALSARVDEIEKSAGAAAAGGGADEAALKALGDQIAALSAKVDANGEAAGAATSAVDALKTSIADVDDRLKKAEADLAGPRNDVSVARAVAASGLKAAIDRGGPFSAELQAYRSVAPDDPAVADLSALAPDGVPSRAELASAFPAVADRIIATEEAPSGEGGIMNRLLSSAKSLVKVRAVGDVPGTSAEAIVARMETRLRAGDLKGVVDEWKGLSDAAKAASKDFIDRVDARVRAEALVGATLAEAMSATGRSAVGAGSDAPAATGSDGADPAAKDGSGDSGAGAGQ